MHRTQPHRRMPVNSLNNACRYKLNSITLTVACVVAVLKFPPEFIRHRDPHPADIAGLVQEVVKHVAKPRHYIRVMNGAGLSCFWLFDPYDSTPQSKYGCSFSHAAFKAQACLLTHPTGTRNHATTSFPYFSRNAGSTHCVRRSANTCIILNLGLQYRMIIFSGRLQI